MKKYNLSEVDNVYEKIIDNYRDKFEKFLPMMHLEVFKAEESIINSNHSLTTLHFLISGTAKITLIHENGKRSIVHFVEEEEFIGELTLIGIEKQAKDVVALNECICLSISISEYREELLKDAEFLLMLSQYIGTKMLKRTWFSTKVQNYEFRNVLAAYILMAECDGIYKEKHTETSEFLGVSYRHLLHTLREFKEAGLITKFEKCYKIDVEGLEILAKDIR
ncbi:MAG: transcriptional regulator YeiL [Acidaminobacteraceae bacterium]